MPQPSFSLVENPELSRGLVPSPELNPIKNLRGDVKRAVQNAFAKKNGKILLSRDVPN